MSPFTQAPAELLADHFVNYLFQNYQGSRHVRRVASWVGLVVLGIQRAAGNDWKVPRNRQLQFGFQGRSFKAKYNHKTGPRGGIEIVEVLEGRGSPEGNAVVSIANLHEAEDFYNRSPLILQEFVFTKRPLRAGASRLLRFMVLNVFSHWSGNGRNWDRRRLEEKFPSHFNGFLKPRATPNTIRISRHRGRSFLALAAYSG